MKFDCTGNYKYVVISTVYMILIYINILLLHVVSAGAADNDLRSINLWEILTVDEPIGMVSSVEPFSAVIYFEAHPSKFDISDSSSEISVSVYTGVVGDEPCDKGTLLNNNNIEDDGYSIESTVRPFDRYSFASYADIPVAEFPQTSTNNGQIGSAEFTISPNMFNLSNNDDRKIWFPNEGSKDGRVMVCVRVDLKTDYDGDGDLDSVSYIDTNVIVDVDFTASFDSASIISSQYDPILSSSQLYQDIPISTYLCDENHDQIVEGTTYDFGNTFRVCVAPRPPEDIDDGKNNYNNIIEEYVVDSFEDITCGNQGEKRVLFKDKSPDLFTTVITTDRDANGLLAFESAVTAGFYSSGEASFSCEGTVDLLIKVDDGSGRKSRKRNRRRILVPTSIDVATNTKSTIDVVPFATTISLSRRSDYDSGATSTTEESKDGKIIAFASWWIGLAIVFGFTFPS